MINLLTRLLLTRWLKHTEEKRRSTNRINPKITCEKAWGLREGEGGGKERVGNDKKQKEKGIKKDLLLTHKVQSRPPC